jgi:hypothetical protein
LLEVLQRPYDEQPEFARYAETPLPSNTIFRTYCGT